MGVIHSVGNLVASFADPPPNRKFDLDLGLRGQPKDLQERHYKVITLVSPLVAGLDMLYFPLDVEMCDVRKSDVSDIQRLRSGLKKTRCFFF